MGIGLVRIGILVQGCGVRVNMVRVRVQNRHRFYFNKTDVGFGLGRWNIFSFIALCVGCMRP